MSGITDISPEILKERHRLSPRQINSLFGREVIQESLEEKKAALETVAEFIRVTDALREEGISFIPLKGPLLSYRLHADATFRFYRDLDILVDVADINITAFILEKLGYGAETAAWPKESRRQKRIIVHTNEFSFFNPAKQLVIELHWRLLKIPVVSFSRLGELVRENTMILNFTGRSFSVLSNEMELLYLAVHGGTHWWNRLKWHTDIDAFLKTRTIDWKRFAGLTSELKAGRMVALCNEMLAEYIPGGSIIPDVEPACPFMVKFSHKMIRSQKELTADFYSRIAYSIYYTLISFPGIKYKVKVIRDYLFVLEYYGSNRVLDSLPLFYIYGPIRLAAERLRG